MSNHHPEDNRYLTREDRQETQEKGKERKGKDATARS